MDMSLSMVAWETSPSLGPSLSPGFGPGFGLDGLPQPIPPKAAKKPKKAVLFFEVEILDAKTREKVCFLDNAEPCQAVGCNLPGLPADPQWYPARQSLRLDPKGKSPKDEDVLQKLPVGTTATFYFRDLGAQISWVTVFLTEYAVPLFIYLLFYFRVPFIYGHKYDFTSSRHTVVHLACICHSFHYVKRLLETLFVHRFSHGTMPLRNIFKVRARPVEPQLHLLLGLPYGAQQVKLALAIFVICQLGNFSIHMALRDLRPAGSKTRKIPYPTKNPFTWLFLLVSCPNYTYEVGSWIGFAIMTQCLPVALFSLVGFTQMTIWAKGKHRSYLKESVTTHPCACPSSPSCSEPLSQAQLSSPTPVSFWRRRGGHSSPVPGIKAACPCRTPSLCVSSMGLGTSRQNLCSKRWAQLRSLEAFISLVHRVGGGSPIEPPPEPPLRAPGPWPPLPPSSHAASSAGAAAARVHTPSCASHSWGQSTRRVTRLSGQHMALPQPWEVDGTGAVSQSTRVPVVPVGSAQAGAGRSDSTHCLLDGHQGAPGKGRGLPLEPRLGHSSGGFSPLPHPAGPWRVSFGLRWGLAGNLS
uniref:Trans-2,3-enoyl-CoA reductase n=1 Tax=Prolemur simus TaxID=1328070 RepID=A0A8C9DL58_PROSS